MAFGGNDEILLAFFSVQLTNFAVYRSGKNLDRQCRVLVANTLQRSGPLRVYPLSRPENRLPFGSRSAKLYV
jgi:hypothetical protein